MELFLFIIKDRPGYRRTLHEAQACLEDHLLEDRALNQVQWGDEGDEQYGAYLWDSHVGWDTPAPHSGQLIWPITVPEPKTRGLDPLFPMGAEMVLTVTTMTEKHQVIECVTESVWRAEEFRPHIITHFAAQAGQTLASNWTSKEPT